MLQLIVLFGLSWLLIWLFEKGNLSVLGLLPTKDRLKYFILLFLVAAILSATAFLLKMYFAKEMYILSPSLSVRSVFLGSWFQLRTVLTEELIFRGVLLYILIRKTGQTKGIIISAIVFGLTHWINAGGWGNPGQMFLVFAFTFTMGLLLAYAYARTFSLLIPFAIHFGWNLTQNYIFPDRITGDHIFILAAPPPIVTISFASFFTMLLLPKIAVLLAGYFIVKRHKKVGLTDTQAGS